MISCETESRTGARKKSRFDNYTVGGKYNKFFKVDIKKHKCEGTIKKENSCKLLHKPPLISRCG